MSDVNNKTENRWVWFSWRADRVVGITTSCSYFLIVSEILKISFNIIFILNIILIIIILFLGFVYIAYTFPISLVLFYISLFIHLNFSRISPHTNFVFPSYTECCFIRGWNGENRMLGGGQSFSGGSPNRLRIKLWKSQSSIFSQRISPFTSPPPPYPANSVLQTNKRQKRSLLTKQGNECSRKIIFHCAIIP